MMLSLSLIITLIIPFLITACNKTVITPQAVPGRGGDGNSNAGAGAGSSIGAIPVPVLIRSSLEENKPPT